MTVWDHFLMVVFASVLIVGGYQGYFWCQRQRWCEPRRLQCWIDERITYDPRWFIAYTILYYPMIVFTTVLLPSWAAFAATAGCYLALLAVQMVIFLIWPTDVPSYWRQEARLPWVGTWGQKCMDFVWSIDALRNSCPSMHVSMATMTDLMIWKLWPSAGALCIAFPVIIGISAVKTKQHYVADIIPGAVLAVAVFTAWHALGLG